MNNRWEIYDWAVGESINGHRTVRVWMMNADRVMHFHEFVEQQKQGVWNYTTRTELRSETTPPKEMEEIGQVISHLDEQVQIKRVFNEVDNEPIDSVEKMEVMPKYNREKEYVWVFVDNGRKWHLGDRGAWQTICNRVPKETVEPGRSGPESIGISSVCRDCMREYHKWRSDGIKTEIPESPAKDFLSNWA